MHVRAMPDRITFLAWAIGPTLLALLMPPLALLMLLVWCPALLALYWARVMGARMIRRSSCQCSRALVAYEGWYGSSHTFATESERFANALVRSCREAGKDVGMVRDGRPIRVQIIPSSNVPFLIVALLLVLIFSAKLRSADHQRTEEHAIRHPPTASPTVPEAPVVPVVSPDAAIHRAHRRR